MNPDLEGLLAKALAASRRNHPPILDIHTPGMFTAYGKRGRYPAVSITGKDCSLGCDHCRGRLLETMLPAQTPKELTALAHRLEAEGQLGMLLSGGSDAMGRLPWGPFIPAIREITATTGLVLTAHVGRIDAPLARALKQAGVAQALYDVVGDENTARSILHLPDGLAAQQQTLEACREAGLELAPHIILGLDRGRMAGEEKALEIVAGLNPKRVVFVVLMPLSGTPLAKAAPPKVEEAAAFLARARLMMPQARHHLGCARPRGKYRRDLDRLAVYAGINALALASDGALAAAEELGVEVREHLTCCSVGGGLYKTDLPGENG